MRKEKIILVFVLLLGIFLRFWHLSSRPISLSIDEVAIAYNSYSVLKTGRDEWGEFIPIAFRSIGDYKPPVLEYLMIPAVATFGLTEFGTRFTVALFSVLTLIFVYFLIDKMVGNKKIALFTTFSVAISPWHIQFSRMTHEAVIALFFVIFGTWLFLRSLEKKGNLLWLSGLLFSISLYTYHAERLFTPLFVFGLGLIFFKEIMLKIHYKKILLSLVVGLIFFIPFLFIMFGPKGRTRAFNAFLGHDVEINYQLHKEDEKLTFWQKVFDSNPLIVFNFWAKRYLNYFDIPYLFFNGMKLSISQAPGIGLFYLFELPFFLAGIWQVFIKRNFLDKKMFHFFILWLGLGPLAASIANNEQHPARSLTFVPTLQLLVGVGLYTAWKKIIPLSCLKKVIAVSVITLIVMISIIYYLDLYHFHYPINFSEYWSYGMKEVAEYVWAHQKEYKNIIIDSSFGTSGPFTVGTPHLYMYFYGRYDPLSLQNDPRHGKGPDRDSSDFLNFVFRPIYWPSDRYKKGDLFVGSPWSLPPDDLKEAKILKTVYFKNDATAFLIVAP